MAAKNYVQIKEAFSKGFVGGYNQTNVPSNYSTYLRNCRIENNSIVMRDGYRAYTSIGKLGKYRKLKNIGGSLYALIQPKNSRAVKLYHLLPTNYVDLGTVGTISDFDKKDEVDLVGIGDEVLILTKSNRPQYTIRNQEVEDIEDSKMVALDGGSFADNNFSSCMGAFYSGFVFINEIQSGTKTNRIIVSHEINLDTTNRRDNARDFSPRYDADGLQIPYKIVCPTTVEGIIGTMQNLYIFCEDSIQYLDQNILQEYATNKTLRSVPIANGYSLSNHHLCAAAGNFVFFFSRDKHVRSIGYTSGIYDPQIADLTDTEFGIQKRINDNIADDQSEGFAFFNKTDQTIEFHLTSRKAYANYRNTIINDITLIWDLQHQSRLIDTGKYFGAMENYNWDWTYTPTGTYTPTEENQGTATVVAGGTGAYGYRPTNVNLDNPLTVYEVGGLYYQTESKYDTTFTLDNHEVEITSHPIEFEYNTTNIAMGERAERKLFCGVRLTGAINRHVGNATTQNGTDYPGLFSVSVYVDGKKQCEKKIDRQDLYHNYKKLQIETGGIDMEEFDPEDRDSVLDYNRALFPFDLILDQSMVRKKGKRIRVKVQSATEGADLYLSGLSIEAYAVGNFDLTDKY